MQPGDSLSLHDTPGILLGPQTIPFPQPTNASFASPLPHCNPAQVLALFRGLPLSALRDPDGTLGGFTQDLLTYFIPEATGRAVRAMRTNWDWSREIWFFNGPGSATISIPRKNLAYVSLCLLRFLPSQIWYRFERFRNVDGSEFGRNAFVEPSRTPPLDTLPPFSANAPFPIQPIQTGTEDADLFVDPRRRLLIIPPRVLAATVATPLFNYTFFRGICNVEVHYAYGVLPTAYLDGTPLRYDPITGIVNPQSGGTPPQGIDWSSGMPPALTQAVARLCAADVFRRYGRAISQGLASISVDGASESYNGKFDDEEEERALRALVPFGIAML